MAVYADTEAAKCVILRYQSPETDKETVAWSVKFGCYGLGSIAVVGCDTERTCGEVTVCGVDSLDKTAHMMPAEVVGGTMFITLEVLSVGEVKGVACNIIAHNVVSLPAGGDGYHQ